MKTLVSQPHLPFHCSAHQNQDMSPKNLQVRLTSSLCPHPTDLLYFRDRMKTKKNRKIRTSWSALTFMWQLMNPCIYQTAPIFCLGRTAPTLPAMSSSTGRACKPPHQQLAECQVGPGISNILIGDSVVSSVKPDLMFSAGNNRRPSTLAAQHPS